MTVDLLAAGQNRVRHVPVKVLRLSGRLQVLGEGREALAATKWRGDRQGGRWYQRLRGSQCVQGSRGYQGRWEFRWPLKLRSKGSRETLVVLWL